MITSVDDTFEIIKIECNGYNHSFRSQSSGVQQPPPRNAGHNLFNVYSDSNRYIMVVKRYI